MNEEQLKKINKKARKKFNIDSKALNRIKKIVQSGKIESEMENMAKKHGSPPMSEWQKDLLNNPDFLKLISE